MEITPEQVQATAEMVFLMRALAGVAALQVARRLAGSATFRGSAKHQKANKVSQDVFGSSIASSQAGGGSKHRGAKGKNF